MFRILSSSRWGRAALLSTIALPALVLWWRRCPYLPLSREALTLGLIWLWLFFFVALKWLGRVALGLLVLVAIWFCLGGSEWLEMPIPSAEASAVGALVEMRSSLEADKSEHHRLGFADALPGLTTVFPAKKFYRFEYHPRRTQDGIIDTFEITATLLQRPRSCGFSRSFMITGAGDVHYTSEFRAARIDDPVVDVPNGLRHPDAVEKRLSY